MFPALHSRIVAASPNALESPHNPHTMVGPLTNTPGPSHKRRNSNRHPPCPDDNARNTITIQGTGLAQTSRRHLEPDACRFIHNHSTKAFFVGSDA